MSGRKSVPFKKIISESEYSSIQKKQDEAEQNYCKKWMVQSNLSETPTNSHRIYLPCSTASMIPLDLKPYMKITLTAKDFYEKVKFEKELFPK